MKEKKVVSYEYPNLYEGNTFTARGSNIFVTNITLNNENCYLLASNEENYSKLQIVKFVSKDLDYGVELKADGTIATDTSVSPISCFISDSNFIICIHSYEIEDETKTFISAFNEDLNEKCKKEIYNTTDYLKNIHVFKSLHYKEDIGLFLYWTRKIYVANYNKQEEKFENFFPEEDFYIELSYVDDSINYSLDYFPKYFTDILKISDSKFCFMNFCMNESKEFKGHYIAIALLNFVSSSHTMVIRYYYIKMNKLFGYIRDKSFRFNIYNDYLALGFSSLTYEDDYQTVFMLLSYANNTNQSLDIIDFLLDHNEIKIYNISYDLLDILKIENNIFGYKLQRSEVLENTYCEKFYMKLIESGNKIQTGLSINAGDTIFKIIFNENENEIYYKGNCSIKLKFYITDPDFEEYENYTDNIEEYNGEFNENSYNEQKKIYTGKESIFNVELQKDLFTDCINKNCDLCLVEDPGICITCNSNFTLYKELKKKECEFSESDTIEISDSVKNILEKSDTILFSNEENNKSNNVEISISIFEANNINNSASYISGISYSNNIVNEISDSNNIVNEINDSNNMINEISDSILDEVKTCNKTELINEDIGVNDFLSYNKIEEILNNIKIYTIKCNNTNETIIIQSQNAIFEFSTVEFQKYYDNLNFSSIDLGQCENVLREKYSIPNEYPLLVIKLDIKENETKSTYVQYEVYDSFKLRKLDFHYCKDLNLKIIINVPAQLDSTSIYLYENLKKWGYNLFDSGDPFYHDVCTLFTNEFGTDIIIEDRRKDYYLPYNTLQLCQEGCDFNSYDKLVQKAECYCNGQTNAIITDIIKLHLDKDIITDSFSDTIKNSNFRVLKCYKKAIDLTTILTNYGRIILTLIFVLFLVFMIIYYVKEKKKINEKISYILKEKLINFKGKIDNKQKLRIKKKKKKKIKKQSQVFNLDNNPMKENIDNDNKNIYKLDVKKNTNMDSNSNSINLNGRKKTKKLSKKQSTEFLFNENLKNDNNNSIQKNISGPPKIIKRRIKINSSRNINTNNNLLSSNNNKLIDSHTNISPYNENNKINSTSSKIKFAYQKNKINDIDEYKSKVMEKQSIKSKLNEDILEDKLIYSNMNDQELNALEYEKALVYDKRSYFQYYWSLLKKKHLILFTFYPQNDYNLVTLKISLFLLGFSLYFTINGFFFSDDSMHKVYVDRGIYNFVYQLPQILYSSVVSAIINMILKILSLSEKNIIELKQEKDQTVFLEKSKGISQYLVKKFFIFFILSILLLLFFWYFISCFCGVYVNTQIIFIKNTFTSFALSMVYPFGINLLPGLFRIPALRDEKKNQHCLYKISGYIAMI